LKPRFTFHNWIFGGCILVVLCTLAFVGIFLERSLREQIIRHLRDSLFHQVAVLGEVISDRWSQTDPLADSDKLAQFLGRKMGLRVTLISPGGLVVGDSEVPTEKVAGLENHADRPEIIQALAEGQGWSVRRSATLQQDYLYVAGLIGPPDRPRLIVRASLSLAESEAVLSRLKRLILWASLLGVILSLGAAFLVAQRISRPIKDLTRTVLNISSGDLAQRLHLYPNHEIGDLGRAFDQMADHLQEELEAVTQARDRLETVLRRMVEGVLVTDSTGRILMTNQSLRDLLGLIFNPLGRRPSEILRNAKLIEAFREVSAGSPYLSLEIETLTPGKRALEVHLAALPGEGPGSGVVAVFHDVTQRKRVEEMRRDFVANVSHELRTPLAAIRASVETLLDGALEKPQFARQFTEVIERQVRRIESIVFDLLALARLESGQEESHRENIIWAELVETVLGMVSELAHSRQVALKSEISPGLKEFRGNKRQVEQALVNLLDNALKYTEAGGEVTLKVYHRDHQVCLAVTDTGVGIAPEHHDRIFERFYRVDKNRSRELGGTGLGLAIVKHIAQAHGGKVEVESFPGRGSTFRLILPVQV